MGKKSKIRRGYSIFKRNRRPGKLAVRIALIAVGAVALIFLVVAAYGPLLDYFSGNLVSSSDSSQQSSQSSVESSSSSSSSSSTSSSVSSSAAEPPPVAPQSLEGLRAATLPFAYCLDSGALEQYPVYYTHLDVYKRQAFLCQIAGIVPALLQLRIGQRDFDAHGVERFDLHAD